MYNRPATGRRFAERSAVRIVENPNFRSQGLSKPIDPPGRPPAAHNRTPRNPPARQASKELKRNLSIGPRHQDGSFVTLHPRRLAAR